MKSVHLLAFVLSIAFLKTSLAEDVTDKRLTVKIVRKIGPKVKIEGQQLLFVFLKSKSDEIQKVKVGNGFADFTEVSDGTYSMTVMSTHVGYNWGLRQIAQSKVTIGPKTRTVVVDLSNKMPLILKLRFVEMEPLVMRGTTHPVVICERIEAGKIVEGYQEREHLVNSKKEGAFHSGYLDFVNEGKYRISIVTDSTLDPTSHVIAARKVIELKEKDFLAGEVFVDFRSSDILKPPEALAGDSALTQPLK